MLSDVSFTTGQCWMFAFGCLLVFFSILAMTWLAGLMLGRRQGRGDRFIRHEFHIGGVVDADAFKKAWRAGPKDSPEFVLGDTKCEFSPEDVAMDPQKRPGGEINGELVPFDHAGREALEQEAMAAAEHALSEARTRREKKS